ncbi:nitroreductase [Chryseolinea sp. H1M3-3]|uniref:nitroreductase family protein n=1 Tax=Chryseolinea sp. H1M3-3 TaxID=3034144 RepID=UPI0023ECCED6|nr:nitroreductase [Chryseolinea sp. H1M3-3]
MNFNPEWLNEVIERRRSVYQQQYTGERVSDAIVNQMLKNANWAPTHKLTEPWRFVVFTGDGLLRLAQFQAEVYKKVTSNDNSFKEDRYQNLLTKPMQSSHIIAVGMKRDPKKSVPEIEEIGAVFCAIQNMYLTATAYGVGAYLSTGGVTYFEDAKEFLGLGPDDKLLGFFNIGMPNRDMPHGKRKPIEEKIRWIDK